MNLQKQLFFRIVIIAMLCLSGGAFYVLYQTNQQAMSDANLTAGLVDKHLRSQLLKMFARNDFSSTFPNTESWPELNGVSGSCIQFVSVSQSRQRTLCDETVKSETTSPAWFRTLYESLFNPNYEIKRDVAFNALVYGAIVVKLNAARETARAWSNIRAVIGVLSMSILALSLLVYVTINRLLNPAKTIITGLEKMRDGHLETRLPSYDVIEWKRTSEAINSLASSQEKVLSDNKELAYKLMNIQEEEQRYIARELHDEFGQCLSGINALVASVSHTATRQSLDITDEIKQIGHISQHMMSLLRDLLTRLRPTEVDDLGLHASLTNLVSSWNNRAKSQTRYDLSIKGDLSSLAEPLPSNLYRIVQECLTNIAKHANATLALVQIEIDEHELALTISDDGIADADAFDNVIGVGLLGIRERVTALGGQVHLNTPAENGLSVHISVPIKES
jgi:signal transduction histidine kinase